MSELAELQLSPIFHDLPERVGKLRDGILHDARLIIRPEYARSVHQRFFRTGAGLQSTTEETVTEGNRKIYQLVPQAFYMIFGEYGTGRQGAATGRPAPPGYRYGSRKGMAARRFARHAVAMAKPQIESANRVRLQRFGANATVN